VSSIDRPTARKMLERVMVEGCSLKPMVVAASSRETGQSVEACLSFPRVRVLQRADLWDWDE
jgi:hypothetical protein